MGTGALLNGLIFIAKQGRREDGGDDLMKHVVYNVYHLTPHGLCTSAVFNDSSNFFLILQMVHSVCFVV